MPNPETFPPPAGEFFKLYMHPSNSDRDKNAMINMYQLYDSYYRCADLGVTYAQGSWGYTILRTPYSEESNAYGKNNKSDASVTKEIARRFAVDVVEDQGGCSKALRHYPNLTGASQQDIKSLVEIFETWRDNTLGNVDMETNSRYNPRFWDFLVIDEGSLCSLAALPKETPHLEPVSRAERMARNVLYENSYVWLIDSRAAKRFQGVEDPASYDGCMKLSVGDIYEAWFERVARFEDLDWIFELEERAGERWYSSR
ncbi:hypothetical protein GCG54_00002959 [Colletotrichum gloeosporioides]|uniref:Uncharacterized protein n=1 Tax=Colletotrichum gloeosporioides TaxID=474922 RepID=A0A8H4CY96_COLGL|nr:uncharacterized protein GCG54_00002959 [Colletotrichum gloeosporioides]KAF3812007.1 hypothetical protein GCG54_00002959 [Colletotrichum gloeosporioides]